MTQVTTKRGYHRVTPGDIETMKHLRSRGTKDSQIAKVIGVSSASIRNHIGTINPKKVKASATPKTDAPKSEGARKPRETAIAKTLRYLQTQGLEAELTIRLQQ